MGTAWAPARPEIFFWVGRCGMVIDSAEFAVGVLWPLRQIPENESIADAGH
jgi:hypothetical protein